MKKFLSLVLALVMTMSLVTIGAGATEYKNLTDKSEIQYEEAVAVLNKLGIITGYEDGSFKPTGALTRGAAAKIIVSLMIGSEAASNLTVAASPYKDVPVTNTFASVISYCKTAGYINGYADGTFRPTASLTGYAFTKMLLGALGYDGVQEGFTGSGWTMNVAKLGNTSGLFNDFATAFKGNGGVTREQACLLALNTLKATEVQYAGGTNITTTTGNATTNVSTQKERSYVTSNNTKINANIKGQDQGNNSAYLTLQFGEEHFADLKLTADGTAADDFGRPANQWSYKNSKIGTYAQTADKTYTTEANGDTNPDKVKDMGLKDYKVSKSYYYANGKTVNFTATTDAGKLEEIAKLTANGLLVEAYMDDDNADTVKTFVVIYTQVMQVNAVRSSEVTLKTANTDMNGVFTTSVTSVKDGDNAWSVLKGLKADNYVLVVPVLDGSSYRVFSATAPQSVTGKMTNIKVNSSNSTVKAVTVGGTAYNMSKLWNSEDNELKSTTTLSSSTDSTVYLDSYGYAIYVTNVTSSNSAIIVDELYSSVIDGKIVNYANGWDSNGNQLSLNLGTNSSALLGYTSTTIQGRVFEYATDTGNNAEYRLIAPATTWSASVSNLVYSFGSAQTIANGEYQGTIVAGKTMPFASDVKFIYISSDSGVGSDVTGITVKTGVSEVTGASSSILTYVLNKDRNKIVAVIVPNDDDAGNTANLLFFQKVTNHMNNTEGKRVALFTAYINGEKVTDLQLNKDIADGTYNNKFFTYSKNATTGVYSLTEYKKYDNKITSVSGNAISPIDTVAGADLTGYENYYFLSSSSGTPVLNAKNATVIDLYTDDGITYSSVKELKDAIGKDIDASTGGKVTGFEVSYIYNGDSGNSGYKTVSYLFVTKTLSTGVILPTGTYAPGVDSSLTGAAALKLDTASVSAGGVLSLNAATGVSITTQINAAMATLGYTSVSMSKAGSIYTITGTKDSVVETVKCDTAANVIFYNKVTIDGTAKYVLATSTLATLGATGTASKTDSDFVVNAAATTVDGKTYVSGYEALTVTATVTEGASHNNFTGTNVGVALKTAAQTYVKTNDTVTLVLTANTTAIAAPGMTVTSNVGSVTAGADTGAVAINGTVEVTVTLAAVSGATTITLTGTDKV